MNIFTKNSILFKLIICLCIALALINFLGTNKVYAEKEEKTVVGGLLLPPICDLLLGMSDAIMNILQKSVMGTDATIVVDNTKEIDWAALILGLIIVAVAVVLTIITAGGFAAAVAAITPVLIKGALIYGAIVIATNGQINAIVSAVSSEVLSDQVVLPTYTIGPEEIFGGRILLFDANIFNPKKVTVVYDVVDAENGAVTSSDQTATLEQWKNLKIDSNNQPKRFFYKDNNGKEIDTSVNNSAYELRDVIAKWYYIIRNIALVGSMLILLYIGIRMITSSIAEEKAKYKQMIGDWVIAVCLIVLMHYIMIFAHNFVEGIVNIFDNTFDDKMNFAVIQVEDSDGNLVKGIKKIEEAQGVTYYNEDEKLIKWPTNQMGRFRVEAQNQDGTNEYIGYTIAYLALVLFTLIFSFTYIKRLLYLLFLTVIAPLVALTYPIDKIHDGKAQAFNMWMREYIFNLLIQPVHLLLYTVFVTMAFDLAGTNVIYSLVVLGFMIPAEKLLRTMFGFNKASTPGMLAGAAGAALTMSAVNSLGKFAKGGSGGKGGPGGGKDQGKDDKGKIRTADSDKSQESLYASLADSDNDNNPQQQLPATAEDNNLDLDQERERLASERAVLDEFLDEGTTPGTDWTDEDYEAYEELERELLEEEERLRLQEEQDMQRQQQEPEEPEHVEEPEVQQRTDNNTRRSNNRSVARAGLRLAGRTAKTIGAQTLRTGGNIALKGALAVTGGAIGLASGIVAGDAGKAFQNTTVGAGTGIAVGSGIANRASSTLSKNSSAFDKLKEDVQKDYYGADYDRVMKKKADDKFTQDKQIRELYKQKLNLNSKEEIDRAMEDAKKYREYGINDNSIIIKAMKADNGNEQNRADNRRIAAAKLAENSKSEKDLQTNMKRFSKAPGIKERQVQDMERLVRGINDL